MLTVIHQNPALVDNGLLYIDRKFLDGMRYFADQLNVPLTTIHPLLRKGEAVMDGVSTSVADLNFKVVTIADGGRSSDSQLILQNYIRKSVLVYGAGMDCAEIARRCDVPYILVLESDLSTKIAVACNNINGLVRRKVRSLRVILDHFLRELPSIRNAYAVHCNGYPVFEEVAPRAVRSLLYLDSRMSSDQVISLVKLKERISTLGRRRLRLLFSGRYEAIKGAVDAVQVAIECQKLGLDVEFHAYGKGSLSEKMKECAKAAPYPELVTIHDPISYPDLVRKSREFDIFISCHVQSDPSCTYLETLGSGLPIVGYNNKMLKRIVEKSKAGVASRLGSPTEVARQIQALSNDCELLAEMSMNARDFSLIHVFEKEFDLRISAIKAAYSGLSGAT